jgi:hypothetical protein
MEIQFGQIVRDQEESLLAAVRSIAFRCGNVRLYVAASFIYGFREHGHVFVRALDIVKRRRFGLIAHNTPSDRPQNAVGLAGLIRFHLFCHKFGCRQQLNSARNHIALRII